MATGGGDPGRLTPPQIVGLAAAISADNMAAIALGYMGISHATIKNLQHENKGEAQAFNTEIIKNWANRNSGSSQVTVSIYLCK